LVRITCSVRMPRADFIPTMSSAVVSLRTSTTALPAWFDRKLPKRKLGQSKCWLVWSAGKTRTESTASTTCLGLRLRLLAVEDEPAGADAGAGGQALGDDVLGGRGVDRPVRVVGCRCRVYVSEWEREREERTVTRVTWHTTHGWRKKSMALALTRSSASSREMRPSWTCRVGV